jgi:glycosyltransferase involved in cell wall biosynthesis
MAHHLETVLEATQELIDWMDIVFLLVGDDAELVMSSGGGICIEPENGKDIADQVLKLYRNPTRCRELGTSGRQYVLAHFDRQVLARKLTDVMQQVVNTA